MRFSEWLDPNYLDYWPFGIFTEKRDLEDISQKDNNKKSSGTRMFTFTQGIVGY